MYVHSRAHRRYRGDVCGVYVSSGRRVPVDVDKRTGSRAQRRTVDRPRLRVLRRTVQHVQQPGHLEEVPAPGADRGQHHGQHSSAVLFHRPVPRHPDQQSTALSSPAQDRRSVEVVF